MGRSLIILALVGCSTASQPNNTATAVDAAVAPRAAAVHARIARGGADRSLGRGRRFAVAGAQRAAGCDDAREHWWAGNPLICPGNDA